MNLSTIIKKPVITEKTLILASQGKFTFIVDRAAAKNQIAEAVKNFYSVDVVSVRTIRSKAKSYRVNKTRKIGYTAPTKKAIVELKKGQKIDLFDIKGDN